MDSAFGNDIDIDKTFGWLGGVDDIDEQVLKAWRAQNRAWLETRSSLLTKGDVMKYSLLTEKAASLEAIDKVKKMQDSAIELQLAITYLETSVNVAQVGRAELAARSSGREGKTPRESQQISRK